MFKLYGNQFLITILVALLGETLAVCYNYMVGDLIKYIKKEKTDSTDQWDHKLEGLRIIA